MTNNIKKISLTVLVVFYIAAGVNHFRSPAGYVIIIPPYLPWPRTLNILAGCFEILFGFLLIFKKMRRMAAWGITLMLLAFLPVHISMVAEAPLYVGSLLVSPLLAWLRLVLLQPLL